MNARDENTVMKRLREWWRSPPRSRGRRLPLVRSLRMGSLLLGRCCAGSSGRLVGTHHRSQQELQGSI